MDENGQVDQVLLRERKRETEGLWIVINGFMLTLRLKLLQVPVWPSSVSIILVQFNCVLYLYIYSLYKINEKIRFGVKGKVTFGNAFF